MEAQCWEPAGGKAREMSGASDSRSERSSAFTKVRPRERRIKVFLRGRVQTGECWADVTIYDVSSRGLMAQCDSALVRGRNVEVRCGSHVLVGRVVWWRGGRFGLRTREVIDLPHLLGSPLRARATDSKQFKPPASALFRRTAADRHETNRYLSKVLQFAWVASMTLAAGLLLASEVGELLAKPLGTAAVAMGATDPDPPQSVSRPH